MDGTSLNNLSITPLTVLLMSELRARNVKPNKGAGSDAKNDKNAQLNKSIKKVEQANYVRSFLAILGLLAVGFFGVRVCYHIL